MGTVSHRPDSDASPVDFKLYDCRVLTAVQLLIAYHERDNFLSCLGCVTDWQQETRGLFVLLGAFGKYGGDLRAALKANSQHGETAVPCYPCRGGCGLMPGLRSRYGSDQIRFRGLTTARVEVVSCLFPAESRFHGKTALKRFHLSIDDITKLVDAGKEKGYLTYNAVNDLIPHNVHPPEDLDDLLSTIGTRGIDVLEGKPKLRFAAFEEDPDREVEGSSEVDLDPAGGALEKTNDPVRIYLRDMGAVPLLTREGEVDIARRIERGQLRTLKALSRSPIVIRQVLAIGKDLKRGVRSIKEIVVFDEEEITEEILQNRIEGRHAPHRRAAKALQTSGPPGRTVADDPVTKESTPIQSLPRQAGPRDCSDFAHHPQLRSHELRAQHAWSIG